LQVVSVLLAACSQAPDWEQQVAEWHHTDPIPDFVLVNQDAEPFQLASLGEEHLLVTFLYTRCPVAEACPLTMNRLMAIQEAARGERFHILAVTLDPASDSPERLRAYGERRGVDWDLWTFATGPEALVADALPSLFNVFAVPDGEQIDHNVKTVLLEPGLTWGTAFKDNEFDASAVLERVRGD